VAAEIAQLAHVHLGLVEVSPSNRRTAGEPLAPSFFFGLFHAFDLPPLVTLNPSPRAPDDAAFRIQIKSHAISFFSCNSLKSILNLSWPPGRERISFLGISISWLLISTC
jgi:hypothetical protein